MAKSAEHLEQLTAYLDDELTTEQRAEVDRLLAEDEEARTLLDELRRTAQLVGSLSRGHAPADLAERVTAQMERRALLGEVPMESAPSRRAVRWQRGFALAASFALLCTAAWFGVPELGRRYAPAPHEPLAGAPGGDKALSKTSAQRAPEAVVMAPAGESADAESRLSEMATAGDQPRSITVPAIRTRDRRIDSVPAGNRIIVESADRSMQARQVALIEGFMAGNSIQNIGPRDPATRVAADQQFYHLDEAVFPVEADDADAAPSEKAAGEVRVTFRIREDLAPPLLVAIQQQAIDRNAEIRWIADDPLMKESKMPRAIARQLAMLEARTRGGGAAGEAATAPGMESKPAVEHPREAEEEGEGGARRSMKPGPTDRFRAQKRADPERPARRSGAALPKKDDSIDDRTRLITLSLSLRSRSPAAPEPVHTAPSTQPAATRPAPPATSQGSSRG